MGTFRIAAPCAYTVDGAAHVHTESGDVVELDDATAAELGAAVRRVGDPDPTPPEVAVEMPEVEAPPKRGRRNFGSAGTEETPPPDPGVPADGQ